MTHEILTCPDRLESFSAEIRKYQGLVYSVAYSILLNPEDSLDLLQETFLKAHDEPRFLAPDFDRKSWLVTVVRRLALNLRQSWWRKVKLLAGFESHEPAAQSPEFVEWLIREESIGRLREALKQLDDDERDLLALRYVAGHRNAVIAEMLGVKVGTVMSRLARLKEKLGTQLRDEENAHE